MFRHLFVGLFVLSVPILTTRGDDSLVGMRVVVINDKAPLEVGGKVSGTVSECSVFTVDQVEGEKLWIQSELGYLRRADVVPFDKAINYYNELLNTSKTAENYWHRAKIWRLQGNLDAALVDANEAIRLDPNESVWLLNRGILWESMKEYDKAIADYTAAIKLDPKNGNAYHNRGTAWELKNEFDKAIADYKQALKFKDPKEKTAIFNKPEITGSDSSAMVNSSALSLNGRGNAWFEKKNYENALADYEKAISLDPKFRLPRSNRRRVWEKQGEWGKLATDLKNLLNEGHLTAEVCNEFAWFRATCPADEQRIASQAIEYATKACDITRWKDANTLDTLAAAYAESQDFESAVQWQQKSLELASPNQREDFELRLKLYRENKPYREPKLGP